MRAWYPDPVGISRSPIAGEGRNSSKQSFEMQRFSIARSLRLALVGLILALAIVAALGVASLYNSRQRYEDTLVQASALATAGANLTSAGVAEAEVLRDVQGPAAETARRQVARTYNSAAASATSLARGVTPRNNPLVCGAFRSLARSVWR